MSVRVIWVVVFAVAMAFVEAAVVVYLRALYPAGTPLVGVVGSIPEHVIAIEMGREAATIAMLLAIGFLVGTEKWERLLFFCLAFGTWDIWYYAWLWALLRWPPSLFTWDVLFLIPVPWLAPVLAPVIISLGLVTGSLWLLQQRARGAAPRFPRWASIPLAAGGALVLLAFTLDYRFALEGREPPAFRWGLFATGVCGAVAAVLSARPSSAS